MDKCRPTDNLQITARAPYAPRCEARQKKIRREQSEGDHEKVCLRGDRNRRTRDDSKYCCSVKAARDGDSERVLVLKSSSRRGSPITGPL